MWVMHSPGSASLRLAQLRHPGSASLRLAQLRYPGSASLRLAQLRYPGSASLRLAPSDPPPTGFEVVMHRTLNADAPDNPLVLR